MSHLNRKLWRDLWAMKMQTLAIALVICGGIATFIMSLSTLDSLLLTRDRYYRDYRFADVFVSLKRAPLGLTGRIRDIPGVERLEARVAASVNLEVAGFDEPVKGLIVSLPDTGEAAVNRLHLRRGRLVDPERDNEAIVSESFAVAHRLAPGDEIGAIVNGHREDFRIVGVALSPEHIYQIAPGAQLPDFKRYGILWMGRSALAGAYDMEGAFNDLAVSLSAGAREQDVIEQLDALLERYGGQGAYGRDDQLSNHFLSEELLQLRMLATVFPVIFLGVAAFLLNVVVGRLINIQREQIAALKAFGYSNAQVGLHYLQLVALIVALGVALGVGVGAWLGWGLSQVYAELYRFPFLRFWLDPVVVVGGAVISVLAAALGTLLSVRRAVVVPPAEAMRPEPPANYRETFIERLGAKRWLSQPSRMIARHVARRPVKSSLSVLGIAFAGGIMMVGNFQRDAIDYMVDVQFRFSQREDISVTLVEPTSVKAVYELKSLRGVDHVEGFRAVAVRLRHAHRSHRTALLGLSGLGDLQRPVDRSLTPVELPPAGVVLSEHLAKILGAAAGDTVTVEVLEGNRPVRRLPVVALVKQHLGVTAYMRRDALNRFMREGDVVSGAHLAVDPAHQSEIFVALREMPRIAGTSVRASTVRSFYDTLAETVLYFTTVATLLGGIIAFGIVYNSARIGLAERSRELASLRVLGYTRAEISYIFLGELSVLVLAGTLFGFAVGRGLCAYVVSNLQSELYQVPLIIEPGTYAFAAATVIGSALLCALIVRHRLDHLDLVGVLKTKE